MKNEIIVALGLLTFSATYAASVDSVEYKREGGQSVVEIKGVDLSTRNEDFKTNPDQLVLTFENATIATEAMRILDTSSFNGGVLQVSAYPVPENEQQGRVVINLKKKVPYTIEEKDGKLVVQFMDGDLKSEPSSTVATDDSTLYPPITDDTFATIKEPSPLEQIMEAQNNKRFTGSPITLKLKDADVHEVLRLVGETSGFNIVIHPNVQGKLSLSLEHVPWDQALEVVLTTLNLSAERNESVLRVMPKDIFLAEKQAELDEKRLSAAVAPRITRVFPISYSEIGELASLLQGFANSQTTVPGASGIPATILTDKTTNSLIIRDTADNIERVRKMIELLDVQTPQVLIDSKVVEATTGFSSSFNGSFGIGGIRYGFAFGGPAQLTGVPSIGGANGLDPGTGQGGVFQGADVFQINDRAISINASLNMAESEQKVKVVSSPRTVVLSGKSASITQTRAIGITVQVAGTGGSPGGTAIQTIQANTRLNVTPRVTNDGSVMMKLDLTRDVLNNSNPVAPVTEPRQMNTEVIIGSGSTLVIGGVLNVDENHSEFGMPFLRKIPLVGRLFGGENDLKSKSELMFFVTPRILNAKRTGLMVDEATSKL